MKVYFDMDGVLTDLYGRLSRDWGVPHHDLNDHSEDTFRRYKVWVMEPPGPEEIFASLPPLNYEPMRLLMEELVRRGHRIEVLSSLGVLPDFDLSAPLLSGKVRWMKKHYEDFIPVDRLNFTNSGRDKGFYARPDALLLDDTRSVTEKFSEAGGLAVHYRFEEHDRCAEEVLRLAGVR